MLRRIRIGLLAAANATGLSRLIGASAWRRNRLLILCYHGISDGELHDWSPSLFMHVEDFRKRLSLLRQANCNILGLGEAVVRLRDGTLPARSVVLTFDDGFTDFYRIAWPILSEFGFPATLYLTTYYMSRNMPVFEPALPYLLWKGRGQQLDWPGILARPLSLDPAGQRQAAGALQSHALRGNLTAVQKDNLLQGLAQRLGLDYEAFRRSRVLSLINETEARELSMAGADLQLHTHRHRTSIDPEIFLREIVENRDCVSALGLHPEHFCYPNGLRRAEDARWLKELGITSAVTCDAGLAERGSARHSLPRVMDCSPFTETELVAWAHGIAALLPHRGRTGEAVAAQVETAELELHPYAPAVNR